MAVHPFGLVDVFADAPLTGNPLAVVENADGLADDMLQRIAGEFNQAETTFLMKSAVADWKLRSFTASGAEVFGAGHNALGAWIWLGDRGLLGDLRTPATFQQEIGEAVLPIIMAEKGGRIHGTMRQSPLVLGETVSELGPLAISLGLEDTDLLTQPPIRVADTGANHLMVRAQDKNSVDRARPEASKLFEMLKSAKAEGCYLYAFDEQNPDKAYARFFNPTVGLWEDSATGTAAGPLCAYLGAQAMLPHKQITIEQGTLMGRPSYLRVNLSPDPELSGSGVVLVKGVLEL